MPENDWFAFLNSRGLGPEVLDAIRLILREGMDSALNGPGSSEVRPRHAHMAEEVLQEFIDRLGDDVDEEDEDDE